MTIISAWRIPIVATDPRCAVLGATIALSACAGSINEAPTPRAGNVPEELAVTLSRGVVENRPVIVVSISNRSSIPACIRAETLQNPYSYEMELWLRDSRSRPFGYHQEGFIPPTIPGTVRVDPGSTAQGRYFLDSRFKRIGPERPLPSALFAKASFRYSHCDNVWSMRATTHWQPI